MVPIKNRFLIYKNDKCKIEKSDVKCKQLRIIHFNDVYNIEEGLAEPVGGAARFSTALKQLHEECPSLTFFSGDALSPSKCKIKPALFLISKTYILLRLVSLFAKGKQMIDILNEFQINAAAIGINLIQYFKILFKLILTSTRKSRIWYS